MAHGDAGRWEKAAASYEAALRLTPKDDPLRRNVEAALADARSRLRK